MSNEALLDKAIAAYLAYCQQHGYVATQPSRSDSTVGRKYVHLANVTGPLARYTISTGEISDAKTIHN